MAILTKNQLSASNASSFPDNTAGLITPQVLRDYNTNIIDSMVDSLNTGSYAILTGSNDFTQQNNFTSISASSFVSASEFIGNGSKITGITASVALPILDEGILQGYATSMNFTGSAINAQVIAGTAVVRVNVEGAGFVSTSSFNAYTASNDSKVNSLISATGSYAISSSVAAVDAAQQAQINSLIQQTGSNDNTSLNAFTQSQESKDATLALYTASVDTKFSNIGGQSGSWDNTNLNAFSASQLTKDQTLASYTGSNDTKWSNLGSQSGSFITESETGSFAKLATANTFTANNTFTAATNVEFDGNVFIGQNQNIINGNNTNLTISSVSSTGLILTSSANISINAAGQITSKTLISSSAAISASAFVGDGSKLTNLPGGIPLTSLNAFTASQETKNSTLANVTASLNASTASQQAQIDSLIQATGSYITTPLTSLNAFSASQLQKDSTLQTYTASVDQKFSNIGSQSGSWDNTNLNLYTASNDTKWNTLGALSGSFITESETASFARTNVDNNFTANQTFTNISAVSASFRYVQTLYETSSVIYSSGSNQLGDELTDTQTLSGSVKVQGSLTINGVPVQTSSVDITALNQFTASQETKNSTLATYTASVNVSLSNINAFTASNGNTSLNGYTGSNDTKWSNLAGQSGSWVTAAITGSSLVTASVNLNTITFTKGDASTFNITVNTGSGGGGSTDITSLNQFTASQETKDLTLQSVTASLNSATQSLFLSASLAIVTASVSNDDITFTKGDGSQFTIQVATGSFAETASLATNALDIVVNAKNTTGAQLNKGTVVRIIGATGDNPLIGTASWTDDGQSANTLGFVVTDIANDAFGRVMTQGTLLSVNTDPALGYTAGQLVYLSSSGQFTNVAPPAPYHEVRLGQVLRAQQNNGSIYVLVQNGYELSELHDVDINTGSLANNDLLAYNSATTQWENKTLTGVGATTTASFNGYTGSNDTKWNTLGGLTGSYATTGSNNFQGEQKINNPLDTRAGSGVILTAHSGSLILTNSGFQTGSYSYISASGNTQNNLLFQQNNNAADFIVSGSFNISALPATPTAGFKRFVTTGNIALGGSNIPQLSGSMAFPVTLSQNYLGGNATTITARGPVSSSSWNIIGNSLLGTINIGSSATLNAEKLVSGLNLNTNVIQGTLNIVANQSTLSGLVLFGNNSQNGNVTLNLSSSAAQLSNNIINDTNFILTNQYFSSSAGLGVLSVNRNTIGGQSEQFIITGSLPAGTVTAPLMSDNFVLGGNNILYVDATNSRVSGSTTYNNLIRTGVLGNQLIVSGSNLLADQSSFGSAFIGRWNADDARRNKTSDVVFAVGTGNSAARKTGFLIDSGSNTFVEGTLNVSGSSSYTGSVYGNVVSMSVSSNTASMDLSLGNYFELTSSASPLRINLSNIKSGQTTTLIVSASVSSSITFSSNVGQPSPGAYSGSAAASTDILSFVAFNGSKVNLVATKNIV